MAHVSLAHAKAHLSEIIDRVEAGGEITITRHGRPVAHITPAARSKRPLALDALARFRAGMPRLKTSGAKLLREVRDDERA